MPVFCIVVNARKRLASTTLAISILKTGSTGGAFQKNSACYAYHRFYITIDNMEAV